MHCCSLWRSADSQMTPTKMTGALGAETSAETQGTSAEIDALIARQEEAATPIDPSSRTSDGPGGDRRRDRCRQCRSRGEAIIGIEFERGTTTAASAAEAPSQTTRTRRDTYHETQRRSRTGLRSGGSWAKGRLVECSMRSTRSKAATWRSNVCAR